LPRRTGGPIVLLAFGDMKVLRTVPLALLLAASAASAASSSPKKEVLPFIEDDYPRALALAKSRHVPIFVEAWAPW